MAKHLRSDSGKYNRLVPQTNSQYLTFHQGAIESYWFELDKDVECNETESIAIYFRKEMGLEGVRKFLKYAAKLLKGYETSESPKNSIPVDPDSDFEEDFFGSENESIDLDVSNGLKAINCHPADVTTQEANDLNFATGTRRKKHEFTAIAELAMAGYAVRPLNEGGYQIRNHSNVLHAIDLEDLQAFAASLGDCHA